VLFLLIHFQLLKNFPYELLYLISPTYLDLKTFGSLCFASNLENDCTKLEPISRKYVFLKYKLEKLEEEDSSSVEELSRALKKGLKDLLEV